MANIEHKNIVDSERHEAKGASAATVGQVLVANGDGSTSFVDPSAAVDVGKVKTERVLDARSVSSSQQPTAQDVPLQIEYGNAQGTVSDPVMLSSSGVLTFNQSGNYLVRLLAQYGRTGSASVANLHARAVSGGMQLGDTVSASIDSEGILVPFSIESWVNVTAGTSFHYEIMRDSSGVNAGGIFSTTPTAAGWGIAPSASLRVERIVAA